MANATKDDIRAALLDILKPRLSEIETGSTPGKTGDSGDLSARDASADLGLIDSSDLLDVILDVEQRCCVIFNPERISFDSVLSLETLVDAFDVAEPAG